MAVFGGLVGAAGRNNPLLRPGINVNFLLPGMSSDIPRGPRATAEGFTGSTLYPVRPTYNPALDVAARRLA